MLDDMDHLPGDRSNHGLGADGDHGPGPHSDGDVHLPPREQIRLLNRFRNPMFWNSSEMRSLIRISKNQFIEICNFTVEASPTSPILLSHESRVFLFLYRMAHKTSIHHLASLFDISPKAAKKVYDDVLFFLLMNDPHIPCIWNDETATENEVESFLQQLRDRQSPGIK